MGFTDFCKTEHLFSATHASYSIHPKRNFIIDYEQIQILPVALGIPDYGAPLPISRSLYARIGIDRI